MGVDKDIWISARGFVQTLDGEQRNLLSALLSAGQDDEVLKQLRGESGLAVHLDRDLTPHDRLSIAATLYAVGRKTYVTSIVSANLRAEWATLSQAARLRIVRIVDDALEGGRAGMDCDADEWRRVLDHARAFEAEGAEAAAGA